MLLNIHYFLKEHALKLSL